MAEGFLGILRHQDFELGFGPFMLEEGRASLAKHPRQLGPGIGCTHITDADRCNPRPWWFDAIEARRLANLHAPPELLFRGQQQMLVEAVGETLDQIRSKVPVDVIGRADAAVLKTIRAGSIPDSVWRVLFAIKPTIAQQAQDGAYHLCVRAFPVESNEAVALFLLYNKQKL